MADPFAATDGPRPGDPVARIVVVCHANIARSPFAAATLDAASRQIVPDAAEQLSVSSAGTHARDGLAAAEGSQQLARGRGLDLSAHHSRPLTRGLVATADLVLTMTERQRTHALRLAPTASTRVFTLPEFARLCGHVDVGASDAPLRDRVRDVVAGAAAARPYSVRPPGPEDVEDPYGGPLSGYHRMAATLDMLVDTAASRLFGRAVDPHR
jgi:protein-tyrosine phosphatase